MPDRRGGQKGRQVAAIAALDLDAPSAVRDLQAIETRLAAAVTGILMANRPGHGAMGIATA
jgi:hypothetical protein